MSTESWPPLNGNNDCLLVIGGCRSGKSRFALQWAERLAVDRRIFVATCVPHDEEMRGRVEQHRRERRSSRWQTIEEPLHLAETVGSQATPGRVVLVDCLTLWITNLLIESTDTPVEDSIEALVEALKQAGGPVVLVSNEVGTGIVPENALARRFRDAAGLTNQRIAAAATRVVWMVAGIPVTIKPAAKNHPNESEEK